MKNDRELFYKELHKLIMDPKIRRLSKFPQHNGSNTLAHCVQVAKRSFALAEKFGWDIDEKELARGAMLHDYYQYDIKAEGFSAYHHGTTHPETAMNKAREDFELTEKELNIIRGHMWPLTLVHPPKSKEALLVCLADKDVATKEFASPEILKAQRLAGEGVRKVQDFSSSSMDKAKMLTESGMDKAKKLTESGIDKAQEALHSLLDRE